MKICENYKNIKNYILLVNQIFNYKFENRMVNIILLHILKANRFIVFIVLTYMFFLNLTSVFCYRQKFFNLKIDTAKKLRKNLNFLNFAILKIDNFFGVISSLHIYGGEKINKIYNKKPKFIFSDEIQEKIKKISPNLKKFRINPIVDRKTKKIINVLD